MSALSDTARPLRAIVVVPANNTTMEPELRAQFPELAELTVARVRRKPGLLTVADLPEYRATTLEAVAPLVRDGADIVIYGCTAAGFLAGPQGDTDIAAALSDRVGAPTVTTAAAMGEVLRHIGARRVDLLTPYLDAVNDGLKAYLAAAGIAVTGFDSFYCNTVTELGAVTEAQVRDKALATATDGADAFFIACSQLPTLGIIETLRARLDRPVWSSVRATAWAALRTLSQPAERLAA